MVRAAYLVACQQRPDQYIVLALKTQALRRKSGVGVPVRILVVLVKDLAGGLEVGLGGLDHQ